MSNAIGRIVGLLFGFAALAPLTFIACNMPLLPPSSSITVDEACQRALAGLQRDKMNGYSCSEAKARALAFEPLCPLQFTCGIKDGGTE